MTTENTDILRPLPHSIPMEKAVLSVIFQYPEEYIDEAEDMGLSEEHFFTPANKILFRTIREIHKMGKPVELVSFVQYLIDHGTLDRVGGASAVAEVHTYHPSPLQFKHHAKQIKDKHTDRELVRLSNEIIADVYDSPADTADHLIRAEKCIDQLAGIANDCAAPMSTFEIMRESINRFEARMKGVETPIGIPLIDEFDQHLKGAHPGRFWVIAAYPGGGKSVISSQMIIDTASEGTECLFLSLEMAERDIMDRMMIQAGRVDARAYTEPLQYARDNGQETITKGIMQQIGRAAEKLKDSRLRIQRPANRNLQTIIATIRKAVRDYAVKIVVIDYVQLIKVQGATSKEQEMSEISHSIQEICQDLGIFAIVLSQLNAEGETKHGRVIEEDADAVINIVQDRKKDSETYKMHKHCLIVKDRYYGSEGTRVPLILNRDRIRFEHGMDQTNQPTEKPKWER